MSVERRDSGTGFDDLSVEPSEVTETEAVFVL